MRLSVLGHAIPIGGLRSEKAMERWIDKVGKDYYNQQKNESYIRAERKITNGEKYITAVQSDAVDALRAERLPPYPYHAPLVKILEEFIHDRGLDDNDFNFITKYVLMEKVVYAPSILTSRLNRNDSGERELWVRIYPHTRKKDIQNGWGQIADMQKGLKGYKGRFKASPSILGEDDKISENAERVRKNRIKKRLK